MQSLLLVVLIAALEPHRDSSPPTQVEIRTFQFAPDTVRIALGTKVLWTNQDEIEHTVTAGTPSGRDGAFNMALKAKGATAERTFSTAGTFTYFCDRHQFMRGTINVTR